jgi:hypothetical protein
LNDDSGSDESQSNKKSKRKVEKSYRHHDDYNPLNPKQRRSEVAPIMLKKRDDIINSKKI